MSDLVVVAIGEQEAAAMDAMDNDLCEPCDADEQIDGLMSLASVRASMACDVKAVTHKFGLMMRGPIRGVMQQAACGQLYPAEASATVKLPALENACKAAMAGHVRPDLIARWQLYNSNLFGREWAERTLGRPTELSPVSLTLNCAPVDDGSACVMAPGAPLWTPDYLTAIIDVLLAAGLWPSDVVPLCVEYRTCCPLLIALSQPDAPESLDAINEAGKAVGAGPTSAFGWHCGSWAEAHTKMADRALWGSYASVVHGAATASWIRVMHSRCPTALGRSNMHAVHPSVAVGGGKGKEADAPPWWLASMGLDGTAPPPPVESDATDVEEEFGDDFAHTHAATRPVAKLGDDPVLSTPPTEEKLALYLTAVHPGRDVYLGGAAILSNLRTWGIVGGVLMALRDEYAAEHAQRGGIEAGLSPALAVKALEEAHRVDRELTKSSWTLLSLERQVITKLVSLGHGKVLSQGPHAAVAAEIAASESSVLEGTVQFGIPAAERSLNSLTLGMWR